MEENISKLGGNGLYSDTHTRMFEIYLLYKHGLACRWCKSPVGIFTELLTLLSGQDFYETPWF